MFLNNFAISVAEFSLSRLSRSDRGGLCARGLPIGRAQTAVRVNAREPVLLRGLPRRSEEPGPDVPDGRGGPALGARTSLPEGSCGQHVAKGETGPISFSDAFPACLNKYSAAGQHCYVDGLCCHMRLRSS